MGRQAWLTSADLFNNRVATLCHHSLRGFDTSSVSLRYLLPETSLPILYLFYPLLFLQLYIYHTHSAADCRLAHKMMPKNSDAPSAIDADDLEARRAKILVWQEEAIAAMGTVSDEIQEYWTTIITDDGFESKTLVIRPKPSARVSPSGHTANNIPREDDNPMPRRPLIVLFHGGGFALGTPAMMTQSGPR
ncbi:hypothetical protein MAPG_09217, partial [Magnaporthiopsis poae ATCC 64411]